MRTLIYSMSVSLDSFIAGPEGDIGWSAPGAELMAFHNEQTRQISAHLLGRGLHEDMLPWETAEETRSDPADLEFAAMWRSIPKVVFSTTLQQVRGHASSARRCGEVARLGAPGEGVCRWRGPGVHADRAGPH